MSRYIDADKLIDKIFPIGMVHDGQYTIGAKAIKIAIDKTPTADVVEVVRCKDCIFGKVDTEGSGSVKCSNRDTPWHRYNEEIAIAQNDFCSHGERRST